MKLKSLFWLLTTTFLTVVPRADAQQPTKIHRIGYLSSGGVGLPQAFVQAMGTLGYVEGANIAFEYRTLEKTSEPNPNVAAELVQLHVDIIVADGSAPTLAAKQATRTIPIVMTTGTDPVAKGLVASLARPGGNITGLLRASGETGEQPAAQWMVGELLVRAQRLALLKEILPKLSRVGILRDVDSAPTINARWYELTAGPHRVEIEHLDVRGPSPDFGAIFNAAVKPSVEALITVRTPLLTRYRKQIADLAAKNGLALMSEGNDDLEEGGLVSFGWPDADAFRRVAAYVDKILKGAMPADLPVETWPCMEMRVGAVVRPNNCQQPTKFELVFNLKTATQIGVTIPQSVLFRADKVLR